MRAEVPRPSQSSKTATATSRLTCRASMTDGCDRGYSSFAWNGHNSDLTPSHIDLDFAACMGLVKSDLAGLAGHPRGTRARGEGLREVITAFPCIYVLCKLSLPLFSSAQRRGPPHGGAPATTGPQIAVQVRGGADMHLSCPMRSPQRLRLLVASPFVRESRLTGWGKRPSPFIPRSLGLERPRFPSSAPAQLCAA